VPRLPGIMMPMEQGRSWGGRWLVRATCVGFAWAALHGQTQEFEVATVKPSPATGDRGTNINANGDTITLHNATLRFAVQAAYGIPVERVLGGPEWAGSRRFEIVGKSAAAASPADLLVMLRGLLAERFQLQVRSEQRTMSIYALVQAKGGAKLQASDPMDALPPSLLGQPARGGMVGHKATMKQLAATLSIGNVLGRPVLDRTGLPGEYDFRLDGFAPLITGPEDTRPSIFTALEERLGLKLEAGEDVVGQLVIEQAQEPSAN
jgi:uncharacterized protein (TIGR03435 family)